MRSDYYSLPYSAQMAIRRGKRDARDASDRAWTIAELQAENERLRAEIVELHKAEAILAMEAAGPRVGWQDIATIPDTGESLAYCDAAYGEISGYVENRFYAVISGEPDDSSDAARAGKPGPWYAGDGDYYATWVRPTRWMHIPAIDSLGDAG